MSIEIRKPGLFTTIVAGARNGYRNIGISPGGAMDQFAMKVSNYLVGNNDSSAVLEFNFPSPEIIFKQRQLISITGTDLEVEVNDVVVPLWQPLVIEKNSVVKFSNSASRGCGYLSVYSGWKAEEWLGSATTYTGIQVGGHQGRALRKGDLIEANESNADLTKTFFSWSVSENELKKIYSSGNEIRCVANAETDLLSSESKKRLSVQSFTVTAQRNRMGYRLTGEPLHLEQPMELVSSPVDFGTIQLLPDGNLTILMADHQTTGGYPRVGSVLKSDLPKLAQLGQSDKINFKMVSIAEAEIVLQSMQRLLNQIKQSCVHQLTKYLAK